MHHCQHPLPLTMAEYDALPEEDGIIPDRAMAAFDCGRPAAIKHHGMWLCADHYGAVCRGERLNSLSFITPLPLFCRRPTSRTAAAGNCGGAYRERPHPRRISAQ